MQRVLVAVPDLLFGVQVANAVRGAGGTPITIRRAEEAYRAVAGESDRRPVAVIVDLAARLDPDRLIAEARAAGIAVFAFGPHLDSAAIAGARAAGADKVVANSGLAAALGPWLRHRLAPPAATAGDGPDDPPPLQPPSLARPPGSPPL